MFDREAWLAVALIPTLSPAVRSAVELAAQQADHEGVAKLPPDAPHVGWLLHRQLAVSARRRGAARLRLCLPEDHSAMREAEWLHSMRNSCSICGAYFLAGEHIGRIGDSWTVCEECFEVGWGHGVTVAREHVIEGGES